MKTIEEIKTTLNNIGRDSFSTKEVAHIIGSTVSAINNYLLYHNNLKPAIQNGGSKGHVWTKAEIIRYVNSCIGNSDMLTTSDAAKYLSIPYGSMRYYVHSKMITPDFVGKGKFPNRFSLTTLDKFKEYLDNKSAKSESETPVPPAPITAVPEPAPAEYVSPIDVLITINKTMTDNPNVKAYYDMKNRFERMNETALQKLFAPLLERFKYAYICKCIPEIQSQMLTCIAKGKLRGMDKYKLDFNAFLKLIKFAHDNYVPLDAIDEQDNRKGGIGE